MELFVISSLWMFLSSWEFLKFVTNSVQYYAMCDLNCDKNISDQLSTLYVTKILDPVLD